jgi:hypothetical protein
VHVVPDCVTVNVCPPIVIVALRDDVLVLAVALNVTVPLPVPLAPPVIVSHVALLAAVHAQPVPAVTLTEPPPPVLAIDALVAESV